MLGTALSRSGADVGLKGWVSFLSLSTMQKTPLLGFILDHAEENS